MGGCYYWEGGKVCKENLVKIETEAIDRAVWQQILTILPAGNGQIYQGHHFMARAFLQYNLWVLPKTDLKSQWCLDVDERKTSTKGISSYKRE